MLRKRLVLPDSERFFYRRQFISLLLREKLLNKEVNGTTKSALCSTILVSKLVTHRYHAHKNICPLIHLGHRL